MTDDEKKAALEKLLIPIKNLYSEITTRGNKFCYPFIYTDADGDYLSYITKLIKAFVKKVKELDETSVFILNKAFEKLPEDKKPKKNFDFIRDLDALSQLVLDVLKDCYKCYPYDAFRKLKTFFEADDNFYLKMLPQLSIDNQCKLYRIRTGSFDKMNDGEMFHIPFDKRHLVNTQRYSVPGYPILYLAGSLFTAWCEMDKPELDGMNYAGFRFKDPVFLIDLGYPYHSATIWEWYSLFVMYPLLMACMVRVKNPSAPFKPEYQMPQLMTMLIREHGQLFSGIAYMSNKLPESCPIDSFTSRNLAVCTYNCICMKGHDKDLASRMQMTDVKTITREQLRQSIVYKNGNYSIDFRQLNVIDDNSFRDINVKMEVG